MAIETICSAGGTALLYSSVMPYVAISAVVTAIIVGIVYMIGNTLSNPKLTLWAKTEIIQLFVSIAVVGSIFGLIGSFCSISINSIIGVFPITASFPASAVTIYDGGELYLVEAGKWIHSVFAAARYHLAAFNILEGFGRTLCLGPEGAALNVIFCIFGTALSLGGGTGISLSLDSGYAFAAPAISVAFNSLMISYLSTLNYLFILRFVYSGFIFFFLPLGIFLRSMPFIRGLGSLMMSVTISFMIVYPLVLSIFYIDFLSAKILAPDLSAKVSHYAAADPDDAVDLLDALDVVGLHSDVFDYDTSFGQAVGNDASLDIMKLTGNAVLLGIFVPSLAMLATIASIMYLNRFLGEEIDLSRVIQVI